MGQSAGGALLARATLPDVRFTPESTKSEHVIVADGVATVEARHQEAAGASA
jgi:hypothetical protein